MTRKKITRKPASKRRSPTRGAPSGGFGRLGWIAAAAIAVGWFSTDERSLHLLASVMPGRDDVTSAPAASSLAARPERSAQPAPRATAAAPRERPDEATERPSFASVTPSPAPRLEPMRMPRERIMPQRVAARPPTETVESVIAANRPMQSMRASAPVATGGERHATRRLDVRDGPAETSAVMAKIDTGMLVEIVRADGRWRYVRSLGSKAEGWVDGTYLAGETPPEPSGTRRVSVPASSDIRPNSRLAATPQLPPMGIGGLPR